MSSREMPSRQSRPPWLLFYRHRKGSSSVSRIRPSKTGRDVDPGNGFGSLVLPRSAAREDLALPYLYPTPQHLGESATGRAAGSSTESCSYAGADMRVCAYALPRIHLLETVWKLRMGFTMGSHESARRGEKRPYGHFALPKTCDPDPSSYLPSSFSRDMGY
jgi:hypothetical protein